ncbi:MAG: efflux transporter, family, subunit [Bacteroidetes bacterium]|nr:efflux transporter, family, subunit [Bacteroidota bacterium]
MNKSALLISIYALVTLAACKPKVEEEKKEEGKYTVTNPIVMDTSYIKEYVAEIQSLQNVEIRAKVDGYVESINVDEGQHVSAGQLLFTIRPKEYEAELAKAKAEAKTAELEMQNTKMLADKNIVSQTELAMAVAKLDQAKAEQAIAELHLSYTEVKAPFEGTIDRIHFKMGSLIDAGSLLTTLSNNKEMYAYFNVSEAEYLDYKMRNSSDDKNNVSLILANGQEHKYKGTIETIEGEFDREVGNIAFRAKFPNPELLLKHGETGKVRLIMSVKNALIIPQKATYEIQDKIYVYVMDQNNIVKAKSIVIKQKLSNLYIIESGVTEKDKILLEGLQSVKEDDTIQSEFIPAKEVLQHLQLIEQ